MKKRLSGNALKTIAIGAMTIDHIGYSIVFRLYLAACMVDGVDMLGAARPPEAMRMYALYTACRLIGRIAAPIFAFLLVEGARRTRDIRRYALRLFLFAIVAEVPYDLFTNGTAFYVYDHNIFWSLLLGLMMLAALDKWARKGAFRRWLKAAAIWAAAYGIAEAAHFDPGVVLMIAAIDLFREQKAWGAAGVMAAVARIARMGLGFVQWACLAAFPLLALYNGQRGRGNKYLFYTYYPAHLLVLWLIAQRL